MDRIDQCFLIPEGFVYEVMVNGNKKYKTIHGESVYARDAFASAGLYRLLDMKMIPRVGDYYYCLRVRPEKKSSTFEYIPNKRHSYKDVKRTLAQIGIQVTPSRYWSDLALSTLSDHQIHPYIQWCPGSTLDLVHMEVECGLSHFPIGTEIIHKQALPANDNGKVRKPLVDHPATVEKLYELGVIDSTGRESLINLKALLVKNIEIAEKEQTRVPFAVSQRMIQIFINRWKLVSKALEITANPYNPHHKWVFNADAELEDRKRKADLASLTMSSPSTLGAEEDTTMTPQQQQPAATNNEDRQNPRGSGGNVV
jgi:hypothetical protein